MNAEAVGITTSPCFSPFPPPSPPPRPQPSGSSSSSAWPPPWASTAACGRSCGDSPSANAGETHENESTLRFLSRSRSLTASPWSRLQGPGEQPAVPAEAAARLHAAAGGLLPGRQPHLDGVPQRRRVSLGEKNREEVCSRLPCGALEEWEWEWEWEREWELAAPTQPAAPCLPGGRGCCRTPWESPSVSICSKQSACPRLRCFGYIPVWEVLFFIFF